MKETFEAPCGDSRFLTATDDNPKTMETHKLTGTNTVVFLKILRLSRNMP